MATANDIIAGALSKAGIRSNETPITPAQLSIGLEMLNDTLSQKEESTLALGFEPVPNVAAEVRIPRGAVGYVKALLAMRFVTIYRIPEPPGLARELKDAENEIIMANRPKMSTSYPGNLPQGSGNDDSFITSRDKFFPLDKKVNF